MTSQPEVSACELLALWAEPQIPLGPWSSREGEKRWPLYHSIWDRSLSFIQSCLFTPEKAISICIPYWTSYFFHLVFTLCFRYGVHLSFTHALLHKYFIQSSEPFWSDFVFLMTRASAYWNQIVPMVNSWVKYFGNKELIAKLQLTYYWSLSCTMEGLYNHKANALFTGFYWTHIAKRQTLENVTSATWK